MDSPRYKILSSYCMYPNGMHELEAKVHREMERGYVPVGGIMFDSNRDMYRQAVAWKEDVENDVSFSVLVESFHALADQVGSLMKEKGEPHQAPRTSIPSEDD